MNDSQRPGELISAPGIRLYAKVGDREVDIRRLADRSIMSPDCAILAGDIYFASDGIDETDAFIDAFTDEDGRPRWFDLYVNLILLYKGCKMTDIEAVSQGGEQIAHFLALRSIALGKVIGSRGDLLKVALQYVNSTEEVTL